MKKIKISEELIEKISQEDEKCIGCNLCMENCPMLDEFCHTPKDLLSNLIHDKEVSLKIPYSCALCNYCTQVCPKDVDLKDIFYSLRVHIAESEKTLLKELGHNTIKFHQKNSFSKMFSTDIKGLGIDNKKRVFFPGCSLSSYSPDLVAKTYDYLKEKLPGIGITLKCCGNPTDSMGEKDRFTSFYQNVQKEFIEKGVEEVIVACQNCYKTIEKNSPQVKIISLWQVISEHGVLEEKRDYYKYIDQVFSIHDPCPTRKESHIHDSIRDIVLKLGIKIEEMDFIRENTLCCGSGGMLGVTNEKLASNQKKKRAGQSKSDCIITYCEGCVEFMKQGGKKSIHILDLLFNEDIEKEFDQREIKIINKWINRYKTKRRIDRYEK